MIKLNLSNTYDLLWGEIGDQVSVMQFMSPQIKGEPVLMQVIIRPHADPLLPEVHNLAMGPLKNTGELNDKIELKPTDSSKVLSTAILFALTFLTEYPDLTIGLDGSDDRRAYLYHSMFNANRTYLGEFFVSIGVDWYVKLLRHRQDIERKSDGSPFFKPRPEPFDFTRTRHDLYRYYMLQLKSN